MGLYLCVFDGDDELDGVEVGSYADFEFFRNTVTEQLDGGATGSRCPTLIDHSDSDGEWSPAECETLRTELAMIEQRFKQLPSQDFGADWQKQVGDSLGLNPSSLNDSFIDVDGEPLVERLIALCDVAISRGCPILFQ